MRVCSSSRFDAALHHECGLASRVQDGLWFSFMAPKWDIFCQWTIYTTVCGIPVLVSICTGYSTDILYTYHYRFFLLHHFGNSSHSSPVSHLLLTESRVFFLGLVIHFWRRTLSVIFKGRMRGNFGDIWKFEKYFILISELIDILAEYRILNLKSFFS